MYGTKPSYKPVYKHGYYLLCLCSLDCKFWGPLIQSSSPTWQTDSSFVWLANESEETPCHQSPDEDRKLVKTFRQLKLGTNVYNFECSILKRWTYIARWWIFFANSWGRRLESARVWYSSSRQYTGLSNNFSLEFSK